MPGQPPRSDRTPTPPGQRVESDLRTRLASGEWEAGQRLPGVAVLAEQYGVANNTVRRVLRKLADEGLIEIVANWGTFRK